MPCVKNACMGGYVRLGHKTQVFLIYKVPVYSSTSNCALSYMNGLPYPLSVTMVTVMIPLFTHFPVHYKNLLRNVISDGRFVMVNFDVFWWGLECIKTVTWPLPPDRDGLSSVPKSLAVSAVYVFSCGLHNIA